MIPEIGPDIKWIDIVGHVFRVLEFDRAGTIIGPDDTVKASSSFKPYGYLLVESPILSQPVRLPIVHRDDFFLAASVFDEPKLLKAIETEDLLVTYVPKHKLPMGAIGLSHGLHYVITLRGTLERYYSAGNDMHMRNPAPEKIFGALVWDGELRVKINPNPPQEFQRAVESETERPVMNWFKRHLNCTLIITVAGTYLPTMVGFAPVESPEPERSIVGSLIQLVNPTISNETLSWFYLPIWLALMLPIAGWVLKQKNRSLWHLLWGIVPFGWIVILCLKNRSSPFTMNSEYN